MTGPRAMPRTSRGWLLAGAVALAVSVVACGGPASYEIPIETPIQPKLDVTPFQRVLIAGFVAGGTEDVDTNQETVRLLRSQLRSKSSLRIIDADILPFARNADLPWMMTAHIVYAAFDPILPGTLSRAVIQAVIRQGLGFGGVIVTDDLAMRALSGAPADRALAALAAGCDGRQRI